MKLFEVEINPEDDSEEKVSDMIYSLVELIAELEEDEKKFKITIEEIGLEDNHIVISRYLH